MPTSKLISGYRRFRKRYKEDQQLFEKLAEEGQSPKVMWIGCSDSRVVPELITGADPGEIFIVRNIANLVPPSYSPACATGAGVEYAVLHLKVAHIVICGHTNCGGIAALDAVLDPTTQPSIVAWLDLARPAKDAVLAAGVPEAARSIETIKTNVLQQIDNLRTYPCVAEHERDGRLKLHAWLYDIKAGWIFSYHFASATWKPASQHVPLAE
jgi:carbonic anhydrase